MEEIPDGVIIGAVLKKLEPWCGRKVSCKPLPPWTENMLYEPTWIPPDKRRWDREWSSPELKREEPEEEEEITPTSHQLKVEYNTLSRKLFQHFKEHNSYKKKRVVYK